MKKFIPIVFLVFGTSFLNDINAPIYSSDCGEDLFNTPSATKARELAKQRKLMRQRKMSNEFKSYNN
tara:strand:+ start:588 stop:788 length:201 start_codon:yes stop_codon:yes gene_type:complete